MHEQKANLSCTCNDASIQSVDVLPAPCCVDQVDSIAIRCVRPQAVPTQACCIAAASQGADAASTSLAAALPSKGRFRAGRKLEQEQGNIAALRNELVP